jgi:predicted Zn-ribbon and HTH transcriptional regulator
MNQATKTAPQRAHNTDQSRSRFLVALDSVVRCRDCGGEMSDEEIYYYEYRCEDCERDWMDRVDRWMCGDDDPMLDMMYGT